MTSPSIPVVVVSAFKRQELVWWTCKFGDCEEPTTKACTSIWSAIHATRMKIISNCTIFIEATWPVVLADSAINNCPRCYCIIWQEVTLGLEPLTLMFFIVFYSYRRFLSARNTKMSDVWWRKHELIWKIIDARHHFWEQTSWWWSTLIIIRFRYCNGTNKLPPTLPLRCPIFSRMTAKWL